MIPGNWDFQVGTLCIYKCIRLNVKIWHLSTLQGDNAEDSRHGTLWPWSNIKYMVWQNLVCHTPWIDLKNVHWKRNFKNKTSTPLKLFEKFLQLFENIEIFSFSRYFIKKIKGISSNTSFKILPYTWNQSIIFTNNNIHFFLPSLVIICSMD